MAYQRVGRKFVLSDNSVNVYGFKLLSEGCELDRFRANPIGYYRHGKLDKKADGVLVKWADVQLEGEQITGYPVINMDHPRGQRTVNEVNDGFLNAASVGGITFIECDLEDNPEDKENPLLVGKRWYFKESSLVETPGNQGAVSAQLEDEDGNEVSLEDLRKQFVRIKNKHMRTVTLPVDKELLELVNLSDEGAVTPETIVEGIKGLKADNAALEAEKNKAVKELADEKKATNDGKVKAALDKGLADGKYTAATREKLAKQFAGRPDELEDLIGTMQPYQSIAGELAKRAGELPKELEGKDYDELDRADMMGRVKKEHPDLYKKLFKDKFGKEPM